MWHYPLTETSAEQTPCRTGLMVSPDFPGPSDVARFQGAYALARWNIRQGVRALINLLESGEVGPEGQRFSNEVMKVLQLLNSQENWGLSENEIAQKIGESGSGLNRDQKSALHIAEIKKWFAENENRFPDWKPGDPLPPAQDEHPVDKAVP